jgi:hypothetical protein
VIVGQLGREIQETMIQSRRLFMIVELNISSIPHDVKAPAVTDG